MKNEDLYRSLVILLKMFKNRPYHLAKYLVENSALKEDFINKIKNSEKLKEILDTPENKPIALPSPNYFHDISQMDKFYNSLIENNDDGIDIESITNDINMKLDILLEMEKYEDAARVRDYMSRNNIKRL